jgi:hypothetical protein
MRALFIATLLFVVFPAGAKGAKKSVKKPAPVPADVTTSPSVDETTSGVLSASEGAGITPSVPLDAPTPALLAEARALYAALEYDRVIPYAEAVLARPDADIDMRLDAYLLQGSSLAIVGNAVDAEVPFRFLLRGRPDYDMSADTPPKILAVFRKVLVEERAIREQLAELARRELVKSISVATDIPDAGQGGEPLHVRVVVTDPRGAVKSVRLFHRRQGDLDFSALALVREQNNFTGSIPGESTSSDAGLTIDAYVALFDDDDVLLTTIGSAASPTRITLTAGTVDDTVPFYESAWFWTLGVGAAVALVTTAAVSTAVVVTILAQPPPSDLGPLFID